MKFEKVINLDEYKVIITVESKTVHGHSAMEMVKNDIEDSLQNVRLQVERGINLHRIKYLGIGANKK